MAEQPEPWLRGPLADLDPILSAVIRSFEQVREDLALHTKGLSTEQVWSRPPGGAPHGLAPLGFQLRHIAGSVDRLSTYLKGEALNDEQLRMLRSEMDPGASLKELLAEIDRTLSRVSDEVRVFDAAQFGELRYIGRQRLPVTAGGLIVHIAEHTQRHLGQAISAAKLARASSGNGPNG